MIKINFLSTALMKLFHSFSKLINSFFTSNKTALIVFLIFGCFCGATLRHEREWWDFANYHYYNAWAFLNDRLNVDVVPAFINTFFSPFIELPAYFLTNALNDHPVIFSAIMAIPYGLLLFVAYKIATLFFSPNTMEGRSKIGLIILLYVSSDAVLSQVSATTHEHPVSFLVLAALYPLLKGMKEHHLSVKSVLFSGFILGAAAGLKMTYALYAAATGVALIFFYKQFDNPLKTILYFTLAGIAGFLVSYGYWGWILWKNFQSPIFPFFNSVFQSPYWEGADYKDIRYFDKSWLTVLFYPFFLVWNVNGVIPFQKDIILSNFWCFFCFFCFSLTFIRSFKNKKEQNGEDKTALHFLMFWAVFVYIFWLSFFRSYRYMIPFDLIISIFSIYFIFKNNAITFKRTSVILILLFTTALSIYLIFIYFLIGSYVLKFGLLFCFMLFYFSFEKTDKNAGNKCCILLFLIVGITLDSTIFHSYHRRVAQPLLPFKSLPLKKDTLLLIDSAPGAIIVPILAKDPSIRAIINLNSVNIDNVNGSDFHKSGFFADKNRQLLKEHLRQNKPIAYITNIPKEGDNEEEDNFSLLEQLIFIPKEKDNEEEDKNTPDDKEDTSNCLNLMSHELYVSPRYHLCYDKLPVIPKKEKQ